MILLALKRHINAKLTLVVNHCTLHRPKPIRCAQPRLNTLTAMYNRDRGEASSSQLDVPSASGPQSSDDAPNWSALPAEIWLYIFDLLVPHIDPHIATYPHPSGKGLDFRPPLPPSPNKDLLSLALTCKHFKGIANRVLYRAPFLRTLDHCLLLSRPSHLQIT